MDNPFMTTTLSDAELDGLTAAVQKLDPQPRKNRWVSLSFCIVDAVWSIGANYSSTVVPVVERVARDFDVAKPFVPNDSPATQDPLPLSDFRTRFSDTESLVQTTNKQRTSTSGGILKAKAVLDHVDVFLENNVDSISGAQALFDDADSMTVVDACLRKIKGEGGHGVRRNYLWMLIGNGDRIKPDRMVLRWFKHQGFRLDPLAAETAVHEIVKRINADQPGRVVNAWEVDHALWNAGRLLRS